MRNSALLTAALTIGGCAYLPRDPFCVGAESYWGMSRHNPDDLPAELRDDVRKRSGETLEAWYKNRNEAVVIAASSGRGDIAFTYRREGNGYRFLSEKEVPCLQD